MNAVKDNHLKLVLQYDGSAFRGWQMQREERTVQGELEAALKQLTNARRPVVGSGRTDRGVHATGQVAAVSVPESWQPDKLKKALSALLPNDIWIESVQPVSSSFHPRFDAIARTYIYNLGLSEAAGSPFERPWCWPLNADLNTTLLEEAAGLLEGKHNFKRFAKSGQPDRGYSCTIQKAHWEPWLNLGITFRITANRFLHHMVRYLVGTMVDVAWRKRPLADIQRLLDGSGHDLRTSPPAPPKGLFLQHVTYPEKPLNPSKKQILKPSDNMDP